MKITKNLIKILIIFYMASTVVSCGKKETQLAENEFSFKVQFIIGDVKILKGDAEVPVAQGDLINVDDVLITKSKSYVDILFGTSGVIRVNENSKISIASIADGKNNDTTINMEQGNLLAAVSKLKGTSFNVKAPTVVASVRGTSFNVISDESGSKLSVLKGTVTAQPVKDGNVIADKIVEVQANHKTDYITEATVEKIISDNKSITIAKMTNTEVTTLQNETRGMRDNIPEIKDLSPQEKQDIEKELQFGAVVNEPAAKQDTKPVNKTVDNTIDVKKKIEEEKKLKDVAEKKAAEELKQKEEQIKKERISNIPTM